MLIWTSAPPQPPARGRCGLKAHQCRQEGHKRGSWKSEIIGKKSNLWKDSLCHSRRRVTVYGINMAVDSLRNESIWRDDGETEQWMKVGHCHHACLMQREITNKTCPLHGLPVPIGGSRCHGIVRHMMEVRIFNHKHNHECHQ